MAASLLCWRPAAAKAPSEVDKDAARALVQQGDERAKRGDYRGALKAYRRADSIMGVPTTSIEVGRMELELGRLVEAYRAFRKVERYPQAPDEPAPFTRARERAAALASQLRRRIPRLTIDIVGLGTEALPNVLLDGERLEARSNVGVNPGKHVVVVGAPGYVTDSQAVELAEGEQRTVLVELQRQPPGGEPTAPDAPAVPGYPMTMMYAGFGAGGAGLLGGIIAGAASLAYAGTLAEECPDKACPSYVAGTLSASRGLAHASTAGFVLAGAGAVVGGTGLVLHLTSRKAAERPPPAARVTLGPGSARCEIRF
jgi:hypothetical protein